MRPTRAELLSGVCGAGHGRAECPVGAFDKKGESDDWVSRHAELYGNMTEAEVRRLQR